MVFYIVSQPKLIIIYHNQYDVQRTCLLLGR